MASVDARGAEDSVVVLAPRDLVVTAIDLGAGGEDDALAVLEGELEDVLRSVHVDVQHLVGIADVVFDPDHGSEVVDEIDPGDQSFEDGLVEDAVADEMRPRIADAMLHLDRHSRVQNEDLISTIEEGIGEMRPEESGPARNENFHGDFPTTCPRRQPPRATHSAAVSSAPPSGCTLSNRSAPSPVPT